MVRSRSRGDLLSRDPLRKGIHLLRAILLLVPDSPLPSCNFLVDQSWTFWKMSVFTQVIHYFLLKLFSLLLDAFKMHFSSVAWGSFGGWSSVLFPES